MIYIYIYTHIHIYTCIAALLAVASHFFSPSPRFPPSPCFLPKVSSLAEDRDVHPPWSWKHQCPMEVGSPNVIIRLKVLMQLSGH